MTASLTAVQPSRVGSDDTTPAELARVIAALRGVQPQLAGRSRQATIQTLEQVAADWIAPHSSWLERAVAVLPAATGFSGPMIRRALPTMLAPLAAPALADLVRREAGDRQGPALALHVLPGNLPGMAAIPAALSLAVGAAALLKPGRGDRQFPGLFIASVAARDPELAACLAAPYWPGGDRACEDVALAAADLTVASGDDATVADLARRSRGRFIGHGHRISFAVVTAGLAGDAATAADLAFDTAVWDQRGCLSPQLCFVVGERDAALALGAAVAGELARLADILPPARLGVGDRLAIRRLRDESEWATFAGERARVLAAADEAAGTVIVEPRPAFRPSPLGRTLRIMPIASVEALRDLLWPLRGVLEGAGVAAEPGRRLAVTAALEACGVHLVSPLGAMQRPPLAWRQGGRARLGSWFDGDAS
ncbi:hypothetical protein KF840_08680 [bacterium]|nr:hypothetical protein [bacterium]